MLGLIFAQSSPFPCQPIHLDPINFNLIHLFIHSSFPSFSSGAFQWDQLILSTPRIHLSPSFHFSTTSTIYHFPKYRVFQKACFFFHKKVCHVPSKRTKIPCFLKRFYMGLGHFFYASLTLFVWIYLCLYSTTRIYLIGHYCASWMHLCDCLGWGLDALLRFPQTPYPNRCF